MSDLTPCPTCQAMLRIPASATMIRCPNCATVLAVDPEPSSAVMPKPAAPPLPFGQPAGGPTRATPAAPTAKYVSPPSAARSAGPAVRARLSPVKDRDTAAREGETSAEAERRSKLTKDLEKLKARERRLADRYEDLVVHCHRGWLAMQLLVWGMRGQALAVLLTAVGVILMATVDPSQGKLLGILCAGDGAIATIAIGVGFGFAIGGPEKARHIGIMGLAVTVVYAGLVGVEFLFGIGQALAFEEPPETWVEMLRVWHVFAPATSMGLLADQPALAVTLNGVSGLGVVNAALEFTRLVLVAMLVQVYAAEGKEAEHGHQAVNAVSRLFWVVLLAALFRISIAFGFDGANRDDIWYKVGIGAHWAISGACLLGVGLTLYVLSMVMDDVGELVDARTFVETDEKSR